VTARRAGAPPAGAGSRALVAAVGLASISVFPAFLVGAVGVQVREDLGVGQGQLGAAVSAYFAASMVSVALLGRVVDRIGVRRGYQLGAGLALASLLGIGLVARSWVLLAACLAIGGIGNAVVGPASSRLLANGISPRRRGLAFGIKQGSIMLATLLGGIGVPLVALTLGWRWVFVTAAVLALALIPIAPRDGLSPGLADSASVGRNRPGTLALLALAFGAGTAASVTLTTFLVDFSVSRGVAEGAAGLLLAIASVGAVLVRVALGWWADHGMADRQRVLAVLLLFAAVCMGGLTVAEGALLPVAAIVTFVAAWGWTGLLIYVVAVENLAAPGTATGYVQTGAASGGVIGPSVLGLLAERAGYAAMWGTGAVLLVLACGSVLLAVRVERRESA
jgi:MFS family permease